MRKRSKSTEASQRGREETKIEVQQRQQQKTQEKKTSQKRNKFNGLAMLPIRRKKISTLKRCNIFRIQYYNAIV